MAKFKAKTKGCQLIVRAKFSLNEKIDEKELNFFARKYIRGFLKPILKNKVGSKYIDYAGPVGISLQERLKKPLTQYDFFFIMEQIVDIVQKAETNNLSVNKIVFDLSNIYINETTKEVQFIYIPLITSVTKVNIIGFLENIIYSVHLSTEHDAGYISKFTYYIKGMTVFDACMVEAYIQHIDKSIVDTIKRHGAGGSGFMTDKRQDYYAHYDNDDEATGLLGDDKATGLLEEEEATGLLMEEEGETALLKESGKGTFPVLHRESTGEDVLVNKTVFRIGKEKGSADYMITDNSAVSRNHLDIIMRNGRCYIRDLNSKNHTYINEQPVLANQETEVYNGDRVRLANEEFVFYE